MPSWFILKIFQRPKSSLVLSWLELHDDLSHIQPGGTGPCFQTRSLSFIGAGSTVLFLELFTHRFPHAKQHFMSRERLISPLAKCDYMGWGWNSFVKRKALRGGFGEFLAFSMEKNACLGVWGPNILLTCCVTLNKSLTSLGLDFLSFKEDKGNSLADLQGSFQSYASWGAETWGFDLSQHPANIRDSLEVIESRTAALGHDWT